MYLNIDVLRNKIYKIIKIMKNDSQMMTINIVLITYSLKFYALAHLYANSNLDKQSIFGGRASSLKIKN